MTYRDKEVKSMEKVRTINMKFSDAIFKKLQINKIKCGVKLKDSISWEDYFLHLNKLR